MNASFAERSRGPQIHRVLVADNDRNETADLKELLTNLGYEVYTASTGAAAVATSDSCHPDAVLLDPSLPQVEGCDVAQKIRAGEKGWQVLLVALNGRPEGYDQTRRAGFDYQLTKPVDPELLATLLAGRRSG